MSPMPSLYVPWRSCRPATSYVRLPTPRPRCTWTTEAKIAAETRTSAISDPIAIAIPMKKRRIRCESRRASSVASVAPPVGAVTSDPEDRRARKQEHEPGVAVRPEGRVRQDDGTRNGEEREPDERPRPVASRAERRGDDRVLLALVGHDERCREVDHDPGSAEQRQHDEADAIERGVDLEVAGQAPAYTGKHAIRAAALEPLDRRSLDCVFAHAVRIAEPRRDGYPE